MDGTRQATYWQRNRERRNAYQNETRRKRYATDAAYRERMKEQSRAYHSRHLDEVKEYKKKYYEENREKILEYRRKWYAAKKLEAEKKKKVNEVKRRYYAAHRDRILARDKAYRDSDKGRERKRFGGNFIGRTLQKNASRGMQTMQSFGKSARQGRGATTSGTGRLYWKNGTTGKRGNSSRRSWRRDRHDWRLSGLFGRGLGKGSGYAD